MSQQPKKNKIVSHTSVYLFADLLRHSVGLIMLPIYTRYLTPEDYGVVELISMLIDIVAIIFGARLGQSIFRYYCSADNISEKKTVVSSALFMGLFFDGLGALAVWILAEPLAVLIFSDASYSTYIYIYAVTLLLMPLIEIPLAHIRAQQKPWHFFIFSITKLVLQVSLNIYMVVYKEMHVEGVLYSAAISSAVMATLLTGYTLPKVGFTAKLDTCKKLFSFSVPLKIASLGSFYVTFGDRYILNMYTDLAQVGIYSLGYKFGFIFTLITWVPFEKIWDTEKYIILKKKDALQTYQRTFLYISSTLIFTGLCISLLTKDLLKIMSDPAFLNAYKVVPIIIMAYIFQAWMKYCDLGILVSKKTFQIAQAEMIGAIVITIAYFSLIPRYEIYGAAWATLIGFIARFYWTYKKGNETYNMMLPWKKVLLTSLCAIFIYSISTFAPDDIILSISSRLALIVLFITLFLLLPILSREEKSRAKGFIYKHSKFAPFINKHHK